MEKKFVSGLTVKAPRQGAPEFIKANISLKREDLIAWLTAETDTWINIDVKESKSKPGVWYAEVNTWKKDTGEAKFPDDDINLDNIPF